MRSKEEILYRHTPNGEYPLYYHEDNIMSAMEEYASQSKWLQVNDDNIPKFYENYLLCIDGTVQYVAYQFVGKEVDNVWRQDDGNDPAFWFESDLGGSTDQVLITDTVLYQELPSPPNEQP